MAKYKDIADDLRRRIVDQEYTYGQKLPYEYVLCMSYHCNKETMKKALDILVKEGLIIRRRGAGTFVKDNHPETENFANRFSRGLSAKYGKIKEVTSEIVEFEVIPADEYLASKLQIDIGDFVYHIIRARYLDGEQYLVEINYMPIGLIPNLKVDHLKGSIYEYIENKLKLKIQSCHLSISSNLCSPLEQQYLGLKDGEPYIQEEQTSFLNTGAIFSYTLSRYHYKNYEFQTILLQQ